MSLNIMRNGHGAGELVDRLLEIGLWLAAGYVFVYSFAALGIP